MHHRKSTARLTPRQLLILLTTLASAAALAIALGVPALVHSDRRPASSSSVTPAPPASGATIEPVRLSVSPAEQARWRSMVATPAGRAQVLKDLQTAYGGVARIQVGAGGASQDPTARAGRSSVQVETALADGFNWDHFWVIASYADVASGAFAAATAACLTRLPWYICAPVGTLLTTWSRGWGWASNHGVWAAVYWWPFLYTTGGRW
jgi:hypothetical protein